jgi:hypothetical protein
MLEWKVKHGFSLGQRPARCDQHVVHCHAVPRRHRPGWSRNCHQAVPDVVTQLQAVLTTLRQTVTHVRAACLRSRPFRIPYRTLSVHEPHYPS